MHTSPHLLASRYAQALFNIVSPQPEKLQTAIEGLEKIAQLYTIKESRGVLMSPVMPPDLKRSLVDYALAGVHLEELLRFVETLQIEGRLELLPSIHGALVKLAQSMSGEIEAEVVSAVALSAENLARISSQLKEVIGKGVIVKPIVDPSLLGGFLIRIGHKVIDLSIQSQLKALMQAQ